MRKKSQRLPSGAFLVCRYVLRLHESTHTGQGLSLAGDELTFDQFAKIFEEKTGQSTPLTFRLVSSVVMTLMKEMGYMFQWFHDEGFKADIVELKKMHPGLKDFGTWLETESEFRKH